MLKFFMKLSIWGLYFAMLLVLAFQMGKELCKQVTSPLCSPENPEPWRILKTCSLSLGWSLTEFRFSWFLFLVFPLCKSSHWTHLPVPPINDCLYYSIWTKTLVKIKRSAIFLKHEVLNHKTTWIFHLTSTHSLTVQQTLIKQLCKYSLI